MNKEPAPSVDAAARDLAALLETVVTVGTGNVSGGTVLAPLTESGPITVEPAQTFVPDVPVRDVPGASARVELLAGLIHIVIPVDRRRIDILVPEQHLSRHDGEVIIASAWLDRARTIRAVAQIGSQPSEGPDWSELLEHQAVTRYDSTHRYSQVLERSIERYIRDNDRNPLLRRLSIEPLTRNAGRLAGGNTMRGTQDIIISLIAVATRSAVDASVPVPMAFSISDHFISEIEQATEPDEMPAILFRVATALADAVAMSRQLGRSALVRSAEDWIFVHLDEPLRPTSIAAALNVSSGYLSAQFRKETGYTVDTYVQRRKVEQAQTLLIHTNLTIAEIYTQLNFYDQSHFSRVFRKQTGLTPRQYRVRPQAPQHGRD